MCFLWRALSHWIMAACVVLLPVPTAPVTNTRPWLVSAMSPRTDGRYSSSSVGTFKGITRITTMTDPRCREMLIRNRPTPFSPQDVS